MDENVSEFLSMAGMALLFVVAISYAFISYNSLSERAELFTNSNPITRRSDATKEASYGTDIEREVTRAEVIMAIAGIGRLNSSNQRNDYKVQVIPGYYCKLEAERIYVNGVEYDPDVGVSKLISDIRSHLSSTSKYSVDYTNDTIIYTLIS